MEKDAKKEKPSSTSVPLLILGLYLDSFFVAGSCRNALVLGKALLARGLGEVVRGGVVYQVDHQIRRLVGCSAGFKRKMLLLLSLSCPRRLFSYLWLPYSAFSIHKFFFVSFIIHEPSPPPRTSLPFWETLDTRSRE